MILFEYICENQLIIERMIKMGVVPIDINHRVKVYRAYLEYRQTYKMVQSIQNVADDFNMSYRNADRIIKRMGQNI